MLSTHQRFKLPKTLSYPVGLTDLRAALENALVGVQVELWFNDRPLLWKSKFDALLRDEKPYPVVSLTFAKLDKGPSLGDDVRVQKELGGYWTLQIYPALRSRRAAAREALLSGGLPRLAAWITEPRPPGWFFGRKVCELIFNPVETSIHLEEREERI